MQRAKQTPERSSSATPAGLAAGAIPGWEALPAQGPVHVIGALSGEGVGPEVVGAALDVLEAVAEGSAVPFAVRRGGPIGRASCRERVYTSV